MLNSSVLLVQADEGVLNPIVDLIDDLPPPTVLSAGFLEKLVGARRLDASKVIIYEHPMYVLGSGSATVFSNRVYLATHAMSLFDLQDVCIVIGSLATLDSPMVVDLIGIYVLKGPYCTLTMTNWFLQALSVIPRKSWGDVARRFTMIRWPPPLTSTSRSPLAALRRRLPPPTAVRFLRGWTCSDHVNEEVLFVINSSALLVQTDEGGVIPIVDRIRRSTAAYL
ncbi:hypothetical protein F511_43521 [Dorcoceras hygrometricum]|uniref:Uncharacterized protein n=1 Tax=Dorcoceras hygrometricum TaxID=472368 RepID=A0A2Z7DG27_9LAMI|nr:hypothetical protein F511_43521 [Dorcoceras hygrometricum]